ncbi:MAG: hypothetical protein QNJ44_22545 [Rhodobacter sp.]|nr:hypothetical protein [Rhodobacter sp.]
MSSLTQPIQSVWRGNPIAEDHQPDPSAIVQQLTEIHATATAAADGQNWLADADLATTANVTLSGEQTIDGTLTSASRLLVKDQTDATENGVYVTAAGAWSRATDADTSAEIARAYIRVDGGTANGGKRFAVDGSPTLGTGSINWDEVGPSTDLAAHEADTANPHSVTKAQVGLGNADNTSDADKPVSTAQLLAITRSRVRMIPQNNERITMTRSGANDIAVVIPALDLVYPETTAADTVASHSFTLTATEGGTRLLLYDRIGDSWSVVAKNAWTDNNVGTAEYLAVGYWTHDRVNDETLLITQWAKIRYRQRRSIDGGTEVEVTQELIADGETITEDWFADEIHAARYDDSAEDEIQHQAYASLSARLNAMSEADRVAAGNNLSNANRITSLETLAEALDARITALEP